MCTVQRLVAAHRQELANLEADRSDLIAALNQLQAENLRLQNKTTVSSVPAAETLCAALHWEWLI